MQPFLRALSKLPAEELNEDVDASRLETALRKRLRGIHGTAAEDALSTDRELLETWLKTSAPPYHPAYWALGFLSLPDLAEQLVRPPEPPPRGPTISFEAPANWKVKTVPFGLDLKKGKLMGSIMVIDGLSFGIIKVQNDMNMANLAKPPCEREHAPRDLDTTMEARDVTFGGAGGKKYISRQSAPCAIKQADYVLAVPGGFVVVRLVGFVADFDESPIESRLHTLRLSEPA